MKNIDRSRFVALFLVVLQLAACATPNSRIRGGDRAEVLPGGRLSCDLLELGRLVREQRGLAAGENAAPRSNGFKLLLDIDVSGGRGEFTQNVGKGDQVSLGGPAIDGPADVDVDFDLSRISAVVRAANRLPSGIGLDGFIGIGRSDLDIRLIQGGSGVDSAEHVAFGPLVGAKFSYSPIEPLRFFVEGSVNVGIATGVESIAISMLDIGASMSLCPYAQITAGWRWLRYEAELDDFVASDLDLRLSGPLVMLWLSF